MIPGRRTRGWILPPLAAALLAACGGGYDGAAPGGDAYADAGATETLPPPPPDSTPYEPEVEEGAGAAVAILIDNSGSMRDPAPGERRPKFAVALESVQEVLRLTRERAGEREGFPIKVGIYHFASGVTPLLPIQEYDSAAVARALAQLPGPRGGTAIGNAMWAARADLYRAGVFRKYMLVITDGENNEGDDPAGVAREIAARGQGAVGMYFVAFDTDPEKFAFVEEAGGVLAAAGGGAELRKTLESIYAGKILAEAADPGEGAPAAADDTARRESTQP